MFKPTLLAHCFAAATLLSMIVGCGPKKVVTPPPTPPTPALATQPSSDEVPSDTWQTEEFASAAGDQLHVLSDTLKEPSKLEPSSFESLVGEGATFSELRPTQLNDVFTDTAFDVKRGRPSQEMSAVGAAGLADTLKKLASVLVGKTDIHIKFKVVSVEVGDDAITTDIIYQASGRGDSQSVQQSSVWTAVWDATDSSNPKLVRLTGGDYEEVIGTATTGTLFADCTADVFRRDTNFHEQMVNGVDYWRVGIQAQYGVYPYGHHGIAIGDVNRDGLDDAYVCQPSGLPNKLYIQQPDGSVEDVAASMGVDWLDRSRGALFVDLDNDGDQDLVVAINQMVVILSDDGTGKFVERSVFRPKGDPGTLTAADFDLDGDLDLYIPNYGQRFLADGESSGPVPYHDANNGGDNVMLRNDGEWQFTDVTREVGLEMNNRRWSFAASWEDYDADGDPDLYVANDFGRNNFYRNDSGRFVDVAADAGIEDIAAGMSVSWGDYNQDGKMDLYVGNMFSSAGLRIAFQDRFQPSANGDVRGEFQRHARGNSLFENVGDGTFKDVSERAGVTLGRWAWSSPFIDINNDGREDIVVANGFVTGSDSDDL